MSELERAREMYSTSLSLSALDELLLFCRGVAGAGDIAAAVKELLHQQVEDMKIRRRVRFGEIAAFGDDMDDQLDGEF